MKTRIKKKEYLTNPDFFNHEATLPKSDGLAIKKSNKKGEINSLTGILTSIEKSLDWCFRAMIIFSGLALAGLMFSQVIFRYVLNDPFTGIEELAILLGVWVYFLGMGYATKMKEHIQGGIVSLVFTDHKKIRAIRFFGSCVCVVAAITFSYFAIQYSLFVLSKGRLSLYLQWPKGLWSASMIAGFVMMTGYFLIQAINELRDIISHRDKP